MRRSEPSAKVLLHVDENSIAASPISQAYEDTERRRIACRDMTTILFGPTPLNTSDKCTLLHQLVQLKEAIPQILPKKARRPPVRLYCASAACMNGQHSGRVPKRLVVMGGHYRWKALTTRALRALNCTCHLHDLTDKTTACGGQRALVLHGSRQARHHVLCHVRVRDRPRLGVPHSVAEIGDAQPTPISALTVSLM